MAYNTGNPIGSADVRDLYDNAQNLDKAMNSTDPTWIDRFGVARPTFKGAESELNQKVGDAEAAATEARGYLNTMRATSYGPLSEDPTTDPLGNPCTAGDEYFNTTYNLLKRYDGTNWRVPDINTENLASGAGSSMVGYAGGTSVENALNKLRAAYSNKNVKIVAGVLRNYGILGAPDWQFIVDDNHATMNLGSIALNGRKLQINYSGVYSKCLSLVACPDETLAAQGFTVGASVGTANALIECGQKMQGYINLQSGAISLNANQLWPSADFSASVGADGVITVTHPSNAGYQPSITQKEPGSAYRMARYAMKPISRTETKLYPYAELAGYIRYDGISFGVLTSLVTGVTVSESGGTVTVTHPAISAKSPPLVTTRDNGAVIAMTDSYDATSFTVKFRDFAGAAVVTPNTNMRFTFHRDALLPAGEAQQGEIYFDLGYGTIDMARLVPVGGNIWVIGVFEA